MVTRRFLATIALVVVAAMSHVLAGGGQFGPPPKLYTPEPGAKDLKAVLFNWTWHMGMLRGVSEPEIVSTLEYQGNGTIQVDGQPCTLTKYRVSTNYQTPGQRTQITCTRANGQTYSAIEVVSGEYAWNEDIPGAEIIPGKGKAAPAPAALQERLIRLWASPQGAPKAAIAGAAGLPLSETFAKNPATLLDARPAGGPSLTTLSWDAGKAVVTFPIPGVVGATATATLDSAFLPERVVVKHGSVTTEFVYGKYDDWNNPLNKIEALYAGTIVERRNGVAARTLTTVETETGSVYVVMPVPASVRAASKVAARPPSAPSGPQAAAAAAQTPRLSDGKPDLTGSWQSAPFALPYGFRRCSPWQVECVQWTNQTEDFELEAPSRLGPNRPLYKPEHWDKVIELDMWTNREDPVMTCQPLGIPRQGPPNRVFHTAQDITLLYRGGIDGGGGYAEYRVIPTDGRKHDPERAKEYTYNGYTIGHWEGDTLVLDSIGFTDATWLARGGFFHTDEMRVVEKFTRQGNEIRYEVTVEDPQVLVEPWVMTPRVLRLGTNPNAGLLPERGNCDELEKGEVANQIRH